MPIVPGVIAAPVFLSLALVVSQVDAPPPQPLPPSAASSMHGTHHEKSVSFLLMSGEFFIGSVAGYIGLLVGVLANLSKGGLSVPPDGTDVLLLGVLPGGLAAAGSWTIGLIDLRQRGLFTSALFAILGAAIGEAVGFGVGSLVGRGAFPNDASAASLVGVAFGPGFAALTATLFMELFKGGHEVEDEPANASVPLNVGASMSLLPQRNGGVAPAFVVAGHF